ncbi:hypothetical protein GWI33_008592 [Rhynchophorus ferrugineus]|uniref:Uncharacterized protein n=1 Tax=Rhynchophorus ferrugineus TaxID=354439 RepID=A0A834MFT1_RHYFE|nr:hypothetical protein GWI33_008592 [Rhynchophorus ferrugineus]
MKIFYAFTLLMMVVAAMFQYSTAMPQPQPDNIFKEIESAGRRVRDRLAENKQLIQDYVSIASQLGLLKNNNNN